jgi:hypothetical protein
MMGLRLHLNRGGGSSLEALQSSPSTRLKFPTRVWSLTAAWPPFRMTILFEHSLQAHIPLVLALPETKASLSG